MEIFSTVELIKNFRDFVLAGVFFLILFVSISIVKSRLHSTEVVSLVGNASMDLQFDVNIITLIMSGSDCSSRYLLFIFLLR